MTIYDIAREADVSPATVSRILTGNASVSKEKRERVNALIEKYNFRPNAMARALSETRSKLIGMICADTDNPYYARLFTACEERAYKKGYSFVLINFFSNPEMERDALFKLQEQRVDAIVICGGQIDLTEPNPEFMDTLKTILKTIPIITGSQTTYENLYNVSVDHKASVDRALEHLISLGHKDIAFLYTGKQFQGTKARLERFIEQMNAYGLPVCEEWLIEVPDYSMDSGRDGVNHLLSLEHKPTALISINDLITIGALKELTKQGVRVPEDISLVSFDNTFMTTLTTPEITSIGYDYSLFGEAVVEAVMNAVERTKPPYTRLMEPILASRNSCAKPKVRD